jgi:predicted transcriptional regulator
MMELPPYFPGPAEVIADFSVKWKNTVRPANREEILNLLSRRPCKSRDVAASLGIHHLEVLKVLEELVRERILAVTEENSETFYAVITRNTEGEK